MTDRSDAPLVRIDARGLLCPEPIRRLADAVRKRPLGGAVEILADDPAFGLDLKAWCEGQGQELSELARDDAGTFRGVVEKRTSARFGGDR